MIRERFDVLREHGFRLLFTATTITTLGDAVAAIALAFAVLEVGSATALGIVLGVRQGAQAAVLLFAGVIADRLPRHLALVGASLLQAVAQSATAALVLTGHATVTRIAVAQGLYGLGAAVVWPAEVGLVPQVVSALRLQQANALQGLSRNTVELLGPALGGVLVVVGSPGGALALDAVSFLACAAILSRIRVDAVPRERPGFLHELKEGWREFASRTWLWWSVLMFGLAGLLYASWIVLGPVLAKEELGGAGAWATILSATGGGSIVGGLLALRYHPSRPLAASVLFGMVGTIEIVTLALLLPVWVIAISAFVAGIGLALHIALWFTVFQREIPEAALARVSSYDSLGTFVLMPVGLALAGPVADRIGTTTTLWATAACDTICFLSILALPAVWRIRGDVSRVAAHE